MNKNSRNIFKAIIILCSSLFIIYLLFKYQKYFTHMSVKSLRGYILSFGPLAWVVFILIYSLKPVVVVFPALLLTVLAGNIFGPVKGLILSLVGLFFSATFAFYIAKRLGKPFVSKILGNKFLKLDDSIEVHGFKIMLLMRLSTIFPYDPLSYAAGLTKMKYRDFILGTMLGTFPEMIAYNYIGHSMRHPLLKNIIIPIIIIIAIGIIGSILYKSSIQVKN